MDFGLITEGNTRDGKLTVQERYQEIIDAAVLADKCGFDVFGAGEQHFVEPLCTISAGEMILGCLAQLTERIRLRTTIMVLPFHNPVSVAERIASIDVLSGGRVEFGSGKGNNALAAEVFGVDFDQGEDRWREGIEIVTRAWGNEEFDYQGKFHSIPPIKLAPNVLQKPHPPLWYAAVSPGAHIHAGQLGLGVMSLTIAVSLSQLEKRVEAYRQGLRDPKPLTGVVNEGVSVFCQMHCAETDRQAREEARGPMVNYMNEAVDLYAEMLSRQGREVDFSKTRALINDFDECDRSDMVLVGDPDTLIEKIKRYESVGVTEMFIRMDGMSREQTMRSIELIGKHVIPEFKKNRASSSAQSTATRAG